MKRRPLHLALAVLAACGILDPTDTVCTQIGCTSGLSVRLAAMPVGAYRIELLFPGLVPSGAQYLYECDGGPSCVQEVLFPEITVDHVTVRVTTSDGVRLTEFPQVTYVTRRPNGDDCPPTCRNATIIAELPA